MVRLGSGALRSRALTVSGCRIQGLLLCFGILDPYSSGHPGNKVILKQTIMIRVALRKVRLLKQVCEQGTPKNRNPEP